MARESGVVEWERGGGWLGMMVEAKAIRVLLVESREFMRLGFKCLLTQDNRICLVGEAEDGRSALQQAFDTRPDLVLMALDLPVTDGIEATRQIKAVSPGTRVLVMAPPSGEEHIFAALSAGADGFCMKETSSALLMYAIHALGDGGAWLDPVVTGRVLRAWVDGVSKPLWKHGKDRPTDSVLSEKETEVVKQFIEGYSNKQIASNLGLSIWSVRTHMRHIMAKLLVRSRTQLAVKLSHLTVARNR